MKRKVNLLPELEIYFIHNTVNVKFKKITFIVDVRLVCSKRTVTH